MKKKLIISFVAIFLIIEVVFAFGTLGKEKENSTSETASCIDAAIKAVLGDDMKKQTETVVAGTIKYGDK